MSQVPTSPHSTSSRLHQSASVYLTVAQVVTLIGVSYTTLWRWQARGLFPPRRKLGPHRVAFLKAEIEDWIQSRPQVGRSDLDRLDSQGE